ncbi:MAG: hypothetical protein H7Y42_13880 [Chitinophagaceae bacterium]|nr:hypothetical protein [Chitinophagaceae bacterium]
MSIDWASLIPYVAKLVSRRGKVILNHKRFIIHYESEGKSTQILSFSLFLQFLNTSKDPRILSDLKAKFYNGREYYDLSFIGESIPPAFKIDANAPTDLKCVLCLQMDYIGVPWAAISKQTAYLDLRYRINTKEQSLFIDEIETIESNNPYTWVAL